MHQRPRAEAKVAESPMSLATHAEALRDGFDAATVCASYLGVTAEDGATWRDLLARQALERACIERGRMFKPSDTDVLAALAAEARDALAQTMGAHGAQIDDRRWYLLAYAGALEALGAADRTAGECLTRAMWGGNAAAIDDWCARVSPPSQDDAWRTEISSAFAAAASAGDDLDRAAVSAALANRGIDGADEAIDDLAAFIRALRARLIVEDDAWRRLGVSPALTFALGYIWTHLGLGAIDDDRASDLIGACAPWFSSDAD